MQICCHVRWSLIAFAVAIAAAQVVRADYLVLKNGGELHGELQRETATTAHPERITIKTLSGTVVTLSKDEVQSIVRRRVALEQYDVQARLAPDTVSGQWALAEWCREKSLIDQRNAHAQRVIELDSENIAAHRALGHVQHEGKWVTRDDMMAARGYVKYKGRYLLPEELALIQEEQRESEAEKAWYKKVNMWRDWIEGDRADRQADGLRSLQEIADPQAIPALYKAFHNTANEQERLLYVSILTRIESDKALPPLVAQSLQDVSVEVRQLAIRGVQRKDYSQAIPVYLKGLKHDLNIIVNRSALALGEMGDELVIAPLIEALITKHKYRITVSDPTQNTPGFSTNGTMVSGNAQPPLPPDISLLLATGQLPYGVQVQQMLPPGAGLMKGKKTTVVEKDEENPAVLSALQRLTGQNFVYDERQWRTWYNAQKNSGGVSTATKKSTGKP